MVVVVSMAKIKRDRVIAIARTWVGTPYHHQASRKGVGADCIGLVRGIWRELYGSEPFGQMSYSKDWGDANGNEDLLRAADTHFIKLEVYEALPGDLVAVRWKKGTVAKHAMILSGIDRAIHAYNRAPITEIDLSTWWHDKIVAAYRFPGVE